MLIAAEGSVLMEFHQVLGVLSSEGARRHALRGAMRRHLLVQECLIWLRDECVKHKKPISAYQATTLSIYANAYYVNLCGALDNMAWLLTHEFKLRDPIDENDFATQKFANLKSQAFLSALAGTDAKIAARIEATIVWHSELRKLRDPAAHRLPLTVIVGTLSETELHERERLHAAANAAFEADGYQKGLDPNSEADSAGRFQPLLESPEAEFAASVAPDASSRHARA